VRVCRESQITGHNSGFARNHGWRLSTIGHGGRPEALAPGLSVTLVPQCGTTRA
jgi:hypothetical protein